MLQKKSPVKVVKFGGSSLCDAAHIEAAAAVLESDPGRRIAVVSAPGKSPTFPEKITDLLLAAWEGDPEAGAVACRRFESLFDSFGWTDEAKETLSLLRSARLAKMAGKGYFVSRGEALCGMLLARRLGWRYLDAAEVICFHRDGRLNEEESLRRLREALEPQIPTVLPGFYGRDPEGVVRLLPRGGSDLTGALAAVAAGAVLYENLTDVPGVMTADPRRFPEASRIPALLFTEMRQLARYGAGVLQEDTLLPVAAAGIPIRLGLATDGGASGSDLLPGIRGERPPFLACSGKGGYTLLRVAGRQPDRLLSGTLEALEGCGIGFDALCAYGDRVEVLLASAGLAGLRRRLLHRLCRAAHPDHAELSDGMALLSAVGEGALPKLSMRFAEAGIPIEAVFQCNKLPLFCLPEASLDEALSLAFT